VRDIDNYAGILAIADLHGPGHKINCHMKTKIQRPVQANIYATV